MAIDFRGIHAALRPYAEYALAMARANGISPVVTSVYRSIEEQRKLRANWEACVTAGLYPSSISLSPGYTCRFAANRPGESSHNFGMSFDSWVPPEQMAAWTLIREWIGWRVPPDDPIHAEYPDWRRAVGL